MYVQVCLFLLPCCKHSALEHHIGNLCVCRSFKKVFAIFRRLLEAPREPSLDFKPHEDMESNIKKIYRHVSTFPCGLQQMNMFIVFKYVQKHNPPATINHGTERAKTVSMICFDLRKRAPVTELFQQSTMPLNRAPNVSPGKISVYKNNHLFCRRCNITFWARVDPI